MDSKILLVDDDRDVVDLLETALRRDGFRWIKRAYTGGDDYVTKPFSPREIVYRIKAQLRRQQYPSAPPTDGHSGITAGDLTLDKEGGRIYKLGKEISLTGREFLLLSYLMEHSDKIISKERLYEQV